MGDIRHDKSSTDQHWNQRAQVVEKDIEVNLGDVFQRNLEFDAITAYFGRGDRLLEVGCGNGYSTRHFRDHVAHVDAFDFAEAMVARAKEKVGEENNRFFTDNLLEPRDFDGPYDTVVCVRVLINLKDLAEQKLALRNLHGCLKDGGTLVLAEGFTDGFAALNGLREKVGLGALTPAKINFYSDIADLMPVIEDLFEVRDTFHLGAYDYLTRVVYPLIAGPENVKHNTVFSERSERLARAMNPDDFASLSRLRGFALTKK